VPGPLARLLDPQLLTALSPQVPKGAMIMDANENVVANRSFGGLEGADRGC
jgi:hypothetical protein